MASCNSRVARACISASGTSVSSTQGHNGRGDLTAIAIASAALLSAFGAGFFYIMPVLLGAATEQFALDDAEAGLVGSTFLAGFSIATISSVFWVRRWDWRRVASVAVIGAAIILFVAMRLMSRTVLFPALALSGLCMGTLFAASFCVASVASNPSRYIGIKLVAETSLGALMLLLLPMLVVSRWGLSGIFAVQVAMALPMLWLCRFLPSGHAQPVDAPKERRKGGSLISLAYLSAWIGLFAQFIFMVGEAGFWAFTERLGMRQGFSDSSIGIILAASLVGGAGGAALAAVLGARFRHLGPIVVACCMLFTCLIVLSGQVSVWTFGACVVLYILGANFVGPFQAALTGAHDPDGRVMAMFSAAMTIGAAAGPATAGYFQTWISQGALYLAGAAVIVSCSLYIFIGLRASK